jgi:drug/metabolite transporter (DMT)-like permease
MVIVREVRHDPPVPSRRPLLIMAASTVCFALMALAAKLASVRLAGSEVAFIRFVVMAVPVLAVPRLLRQALDFQRLDLLIYRGIFGGLAILLYFSAIAHIPVGIATLLNYVSPVFSVAFAAIFLGERVDRRLVVPLVVALVGMMLAAGGGRGFAELLHFSRWEIAGMTSAVLTGAAVAAIRAARRTESSWSIYGSLTLFGLLATGPFAYADFKRPTPWEWLLLLGVGLGSISAQLLMTYAYRWVTNLQAGVLMQLTVVLSILLGAVFLGDRPAPIQIVGSVLTLSGVIGVVWLQSTPRAVE